MKPIDIGRTSEPMVAAADDRRHRDRRDPDWLMCSHGSVLDVSDHGLRLLSPRRLNGFHEIRVWDNRGSITLVAGVRWTRRLGFRRHEVGLQLTGLTPAQAEHLESIGSGMSFR